MKTVSLSLAKQLKEVGFPQQAEFNWQRSWHDKPYKFNPGGAFETADKEAWFAAPTADEILDRLPAFTHLPYFLYIWKDDAGLYRIVYCSSADLSIGGKKPNYPIEKQKSLAEAAGEMWLYLRKEKLL